MLEGNQEHWLLVLASSLIAWAPCRDDIIAPPSLIFLITFLLYMMKPQDPWGKGHLRSLYGRPLLLFKKQVTPSLTFSFFASKGIILGGDLTFHISSNPFRYLLPCHTLDYFSLRFWYCSFYFFPFLFMQFPSYNRHPSFFFLILCFWCDCADCFLLWWWVVWFYSERDLKYLAYIMAWK